MSGGNKNRWSRTTGKKQRAISHDHEPPAAQSRALTPPFRNSPYTRPEDAKREGLGEGGGDHVALFAFVHLGAPARGARARRTRHVPELHALAQCRFDPVAHEGPRAHVLGLLL